MRIRRCAVVFIEPREALAIDWNALFSGEGALAATLSWVALAPHRDAEAVLDALQVEALGGLGQTAWIERTPFEVKWGEATVEALLELGLILDDQPGPNHWRERDDMLRSQHWRGLSATAHMFSRWDTMAVDSGMHFPTFDELVEAYGAPPSPTVERCAADAALSLPPAQDGLLDQTLMLRYTGRNFDPEARLPLAVAARLLQRTFGAQAKKMMAPDAYVLKKGSPSAGGLHPIEAYVLARRVEGVPAGLYHYHSVRHVLEPLGALDDAAATALASQAVADQHWFVDAPMMVIMSARVLRNFWKYRNHAKAHRAMMLDAGHLSQTFYLLAAEAGMPAFVTAAINEAPIERAFGLDPLCDAVIAVCGCGVAGTQETTPELRFGE